VTNTRPSFGVSEAASHICSFADFAGVAPNVVVLPQSWQPPCGFAANQVAGASNGNNGARAAILGKRRLLDEL
jgi:hypothetical protein